MPRHIGTCFRFYTKMLYIQALTLDFIHKCVWKKKHLHIEFIVNSHNSVLNIIKCDCSTFESNLKIAYQAIALICCSHMLALLFCGFLLDLIFYVLVFFNSITYIIARNITQKDYAGFFLRVLVLESLTKKRIRRLALF